MTSKPPSPAASVAGVVRRGTAYDGASVPTMVTPSSAPPKPTLTTTTATAPAVPQAPASGDK